MTLWTQTQKLEMFSWALKKSQEQFNATTHVDRVAKHFCKKVLHVSHAKLGNKKALPINGLRTFTPYARNTTIL
jgi:hypothetical protein